MQDRIAKRKTGADRHTLEYTYELFSALASPMPERRYSFFYDCHAGFWGFFGVFFKKTPFKYFMPFSSIALLQLSVQATGSGQIWTGNRQVFSKSGLYPTLWVSFSEEPSTQVYAIASERHASCKSLRHESEYCHAPQALGEGPVFAPKLGFSCKLRRYHTAFLVNHHG